MAPLTFAQARTALANRLNDSAHVRWPAAQLGVELNNALRFWNALTADTRVQWNLPLTTPSGYMWGTAGAWSYAVPSPWYDLQTIAGSPRLCTLTQFDVCSWLQWALLEPQAANGSATAGQFPASALLDAVQGRRDEFLMRTGCTSVVEYFSPTPDQPAFAIPQSVIQVRRAYWLPGPVLGGNAYPLMRADPLSIGAYQNAWPVTQSTDPVVYSQGVEPPLTMTLAPPPGYPGLVEALCLETQPPLTTDSPVVLQLPSDYVPAILWGALADLLDSGSGMELADPTRAAYAQQRYESYIEMMTLYPSVLAARPAGTDVWISAAEQLDAYQPQWRTLVDSPVALGLSGQNLIAWPSTIGGYASLLVAGNAPVLVADDDPLPYGNETTDALIDYAQHTASFNLGGAEFESTMPLLKSLMELAAHRNAKVRALSLYRDVMFAKPQLEEQTAPSEVTVG